jgi:hypothetical protein
MPWKAHSLTRRHRIDNVQIINHHNDARKHRPRRDIMKRLTITAATLAVLIMASQAVFAGPHRIGAGARYNMSVTSLGDGFDEGGLSWIASYQYAPIPLVKIEADVEMLPKDLTGLDKMVIVPQAYVLLGGTIYGGLGVGMAYCDGDFADDPIFNARAGLDFSLLNTLHLDIHGNYGFLDFDQLSDFDSDNITLGAIARLEF